MRNLDVLWQWRMRFSCWLIGLAIKTLPEGWRKKNAVRNLIATGHIEIKERSL